MTNDKGRLLFISIWPCAVLKNLLSHIDHAFAFSNSI